MRKLTLIFYILFLINFSQAQNLVPNWSFEDTVSCPSGGGQVNLATGWSSYRSSPDYCHSCSNSFNSVPNNQWGHQYPKSGEAYIGLITAHTSVVQNSREFVGITLSQPFIPGEKYFIAFHTVMAFNNISNLSGLASNKLGLKFSTIPFSVSNPAPIDNFAHIYTDTIVTDSINWTKISGSFISDSAYQYIIVGNFFTDSFTTTISFNSNAHHAYYFIDDILISTDSNFVNSINSYISPEIISIFPNPARDWITVEGRDISALILFDVLGNKVYEHSSSVISPHKISVEKLSSGIYLLVAQIDKNVIRKKIIVTKN